MSKKSVFKNNPELECLIIDNIEESATFLQELIWEKLRLYPSLAMIRKLKQELKQNI